MNYIGGNHLPAVFVCKEFEPIFSVSVKTIRADLEALAEFGLMERIRLNRRLTGYRLSKNARKNPQ
jgi:DeoR/GlpR family transcriptional regulator of sugar metabolism